MQSAILAPLPVVTPAMAPPVGFDTQVGRFGTRLTDKTIEPAYVTFGIGADGHVDRATLKPALPIANFSFDCQDLLFRSANAKPRFATP